MKKLLLSFFAALAASAQTVFVDMAELVQRHPRTAADRAALEQDFGAMEAEAEALRNELKTLGEAFEAAVAEAQNPGLSATAKKKAEDDAKAKRDRLVERDRQAGERIQDLRMKIEEKREIFLETTTSEIRKVIAIVARKRGYAAVLPKALAVYMDPALDITAEIAGEMLLPELPAAAD